MILLGLLGISVNLKQKSIETREKKVLFIDQLYEKGINNEFSITCQNILVNKGYKIKTIRGENVTLETLTTLDWKRSLIILRMHSGVFENSTWLFTGQKYSNTRYVLEQLSGDINIGRCPSYEHPVFTFSSQFIKRHFEFTEDSTIIMMGCNGMEMEDISSSFHEKGCKIVIGWSGPISKTKTDEVSLSVIEHFLTGAPIDQIIEKQNQELYTSPNDSRLIISIS